MRKDSGFDVTDHITVCINGNEKVEGVIKSNEQEIAKIVLADEFKYSHTDANAKEWNINGEQVVLSVVKR